MKTIKKQLKAVMAFQSKVSELFCAWKVVIDKAIEFAIYWKTEKGGISCI